VHVLLTWLILSISLWVASLVVPGFQLKGTLNIIKVAALFGVLNWVLGWLIFSVLVVGTLGIGYLLAFLTRWVVSALLLKLTDVLSDSLTVKGFLPAFMGALVMSGVGTFAEYLLARAF
jgi:putative membrane protein